MMDKFVLDLTELWTEVGLELKPRQNEFEESAKFEGTNSGTFEKLGFCPQGGETCEYCQKPLMFEKLEAREKISVSVDNFDNLMRIHGSGCQKPNCPQLVTAAA